MLPNIFKHHYILIKGDFGKILDGITDKDSFSTLIIETNQPKRCYWETCPFWLKIMLRHDKRCVIKLGLSHSHHTFIHKCKWVCILFCKVYGFLVYFKSFLKSFWFINFFKEIKMGTHKTCICNFYLWSMSYIERNHEAFSTISMELIKSFISHSFLMLLVWNRVSII